MADDTDTTVVVAITETRTRQITFTRDAFLDYVMRVPQLASFADDWLLVEDLARLVEDWQPQAFEDLMGHPSAIDRTETTWHVEVNR